MAKEYIDLDELNQVSDPIRKEKTETKLVEKKEASKDASKEKARSEKLEKEKAEKIEAQKEKSDPRELKLIEEDFQSNQEKILASKPQVSNTTTNVVVAPMVQTKTNAKSIDAKNQATKGAIASDSKKDMQIKASNSNIKENKTSKPDVKSSPTPLKATLVVNKSASKPASRDATKNMLNSNAKRKSIATNKKVSKIALSRKNKENGKPVKDRNWKIIALLAIAAVIIGIIIYFAVAGLPAPKGKESVIAVVNGEPIYQSEIENRYNLLQTTTSTIITKEQILNMTIVDALLVQEAKRKGISTTDEEVELLMAEIMTSNGIDKESLKQDLALKNVSYEYVLDLYKDTLTISKLINNSFTNITVTDDEVEDFYEQNKNMLVVPDMVQVRHILFLFAQNTELETLARAESIKEQIDSSKSNYCELVKNYTDDEASRNTCGEYNFTADFPFVPEFLEAGFDMTPNEVRIVRSELGYHIMYKVADIPEHIALIDDVRSQIKAVILEDKTLALYRLLISELYEGAIIEIYSQEASTKRFNQVNKADEIETIKTEEIQEPSEIDTQIDTRVEVTKEVLTTEQSIIMNFANCLTDKGSRMFTASWSPDSKAQLDMFEKYASNLVVVECDESVANSNPTECANVLKKEFPTWPTWQINGELYEGKQTLPTLARISGCSYN